MSLAAMVSCTAKSSSRLSKIPKCGIQGRRNYWKGSSNCLQKLKSFPLPPNPVLDLGEGWEGGLQYLLSQLLKEFFFVDIDLTIKILRL
jgi:hypothetical protein